MGLQSYYFSLCVFQCKILEQRLEQGMVFTEYERILKKRLVDGECSTARLPENAERNRFQDVLPYDDARGGAGPDQGEQHRLYQRLPHQGEGSVRMVGQSPQLNH